jgi:hypothetical protein
MHAKSETPAGIAGSSLAFPRSTRDRVVASDHQQATRRSPIAVSTQFVHKLGGDRASVVRPGALEERSFRHARTRSYFRPRLGDLRKPQNQSTASTVRAPKEAFMKQFWLVVAAGLVLVSLLPNDALAQGPRMVGGGISGGGGFRGAAIGPRIGGGGIGGFRGAAVGPRFVGGGVGGFRGAAIGPRFSGARVAAGPGWGWRGRRGFGWWGFPVGLGIGLGAFSYGYPYAYDYGYGYPYGYGYGDSCLAWTGFNWVNYCY